MRGRRLGAAVVAVVAALTLAACTHASGTPAPPAGQPAPTVTSGPGASPTRPNVVFVLTDDLAWNLLPYMPHVLALERAGMTFTHYTVADSLCCPSRASIFTGEFPHDTHVVTNGLPTGGYGRFAAEGEQQHTFATTIQAAGYRTGFMGKYLNQFNLTPDPTAHLPKPDRQNGMPAYTPPGWSVWDAVNGNGYFEYNYDIAQNGRVAYGGTAPEDYLTTVLQSDALQFVDDSMKAGQPFLLEDATFAPHGPAVPAPQDRHSFAGLQAPRDPSFGHKPVNVPAWMASIPPFTAQAVASMDRTFERRVESVQAVDRMIGAIEKAVAERGQTGNTVFVFSSDNGLHIGEHGLLPGKQTAFDTDIEVPLIVAGPGIPAGTVNTDLVQNVDLAPTLDALTGATPPGDQASLIDGHSFLPLLHGDHVPWRTLALVEHHGNNLDPHDPDFQTRAHGNPPSYVALRGPTFTYIRYADPQHPGMREYYDLAADPHELVNAIGTLSPARIRQLDAELDALTHCHGPAQCWAAGHPGPGTATSPSSARQAVGRATVRLPR